MRLHEDQRVKSWRLLGCALFTSATPPRRNSLGLRAMSSRHGRTVWLGSTFVPNAEKPRSWGQSKGFCPWDFPLFIYQDERTWFFLFYWAGELDKQLLIPFLLSWVLGYDSGLQQKRLTILLNNFKFCFFKCQLKCLMLSL